MNKSLILTLTDLEEAIGDYKQGLYEEKQFLSIIKDLSAKLYLTANFDEIMAKESLAEEKMA